MALPTFKYHPEPVATDPITHTWASRNGARVCAGYAVAQWSTHKMVPYKANSTTQNDFGATTGAAATTGGPPETSSCARIHLLLPNWGFM